ncbi:uridine kinase [Roseicyclus mahoneyensis]|uniref:Pantothenate kinase n=1 Tax=Roseicyclus mahoneyensis TaxID=164332 RepID=A0A316GNM2_9RHOB|nr:uridine kinase [Roseicyclus mahoneyensis]PWK62379.1 hypothetical protein C7455_101405 [Roseicyclus mahoneyensis]
MTDRTVDAILARVDASRKAAGRVLVGIAGAPASGKSTLAQKVVAALVARDGPGSAALVPMDGYHLDNTVLDARGLRAVKGAPQTFDAEGFVALLCRIKAQDGPIRYPLFDRALDATVRDAGKVDATTPVVVVEGNYLLLQDPPWADLAGLFDLTVMLSVPLEELRTRLLQRWRDHGLSAAEAQARAEGNDIVNAARVIAGSAPADLTVGPGAVTSDHAGDG